MHNSNNRNVSTPIGNPINVATHLRTYVLRATANRQGPVVQIQSIGGHKIDNLYVDGQRGWDEFVAAIIEMDNKVRAHERGIKVSLARTVEEIVAPATVQPRGVDLEDPEFRTEDAPKLNQPKRQREALFPSERVWRADTTPKQEEVIRKNSAPLAEAAEGVTVG